MFRFFATALAVLTVTTFSGGVASAKSCRDAHGKFTKCPAPKHCRDAHGKFTKCPR